eukprot:TRINITY_DN1108_c3_g1_i1.p1 TRINITY_DN1108_c3_g1~~TRINITY_DN1108_c3_g1_i1.p1  ORF type:complete len:534 (-),score=211.99 TRINITY_DN1108_c3_g1_i1:11-1576(-)
MAENNNNEIIYKEIGDVVEDDQERPHEIESFCMNCHENGITKILLVNIPFFREVILMSFRCDHCGWSNNEIQSGGIIQEFGCDFQLTVEDMNDLNRQIVKSEYASLSIPEIQFEIIRGIQKGGLTTVEGILRRAMEGLAQEQPVRRIMDPENAQKIDDYIKVLEKAAEGESFPFTVVLRDISGNSFIQNPNAPKKDEKLKISYFRRTPIDDNDLGIISDDDLALLSDEDKNKPGKFETTLKTKNVSSDGASILKSEDVEKLQKKMEEIKLQEKKKNSQKDVEEIEKEIDDEEIYSEDVYLLPTGCTSCGYIGSIKTQLIDIPHFKECIIMSFVCDKCGFRSTEIKAGGAVSEKGQKITLNVTCSDDLNRDILKSETASIEIPELELEVTTGTLGGRFTTIEGILVQVRDQFKQNPFILGDSSEQGLKEKWENYFETFEKILSGEENFHFVLDDPLSNSYIQNIFAPDPDPELTIENYFRSFEQDEFLGLNDINTENYLDESNNNNNDNNDDKEDNLQSIQS